MSASKVIRRVTYNEGGFTMLTSEESEHGSFHLIDIDTDTDTGGIPIHDEWYDSERRAHARRPCATTPSERGSHEAEH